MKLPIFDRVDYKAISQDQTAHRHSTGKNDSEWGRKRCLCPRVKGPQCLFQIFTWMCVLLTKLTVTEI